MKAFIAFLGLFLSQAQAETTPICLSRAQASALVDQGQSQNYRLQSLESGQLKLERLRQPLSFWIFSPTNRVMTAEELQLQCHTRFVEFQKGRFTGLLESLRQSNPLALLFYYSLAAAGTSDQICGRLGAARLYRLMINGADAHAFGDELYVNEEGPLPVLYENQRGMVFRPESCSFYRSK